MVINKIKEQLTTGLNMTIDHFSGIWQNVCELFAHKPMQFI